MTKKTKTKNKKNKNTKKPPKQSNKETNRKEKEEVLARLWRKKNLCALLVGRQIGASIVKTNTEFPQKMKKNTAT